MLAKIQSLLPNALFAGHIWDSNNPQLKPYFNGQSIVQHAVAVRENKQPFSDFWNNFQSWFTGTRQPAVTMIEGAPPDQIAYGYGTWNVAQAIPPATFEFGRTFYPNMRFGLATALMNDGFFFHDFGDVHTIMNDLKTVWWYDEYDFDLGSSIGSSALASPPAWGNSLVRNGGFEDLIRNEWGFGADANQGAAATWERTPAVAAEGSDSLHIMVSASAKSNNVQLWQGTIGLAKGLSYTLRFWARSSNARNMRVDVLKDGGDFHSYGLSTVVPLSSSWKEYITSFQANETATDGRVNFYFGEQTGDTWIDGVVLQSGLDSVYRRDFTSGIALLNGTQNAVRVALEPGFIHFTGSQAPRIQYLIDDTLDLLATQGNWRTVRLDSGFDTPKPSGPYYHAWNSLCHISDDGSGVAEWQLAPPEDGEYTIQAWWPAAPSIETWTHRAMYEIVNEGQVIALAMLDQSTAGDQWHTIAKVQFTSASAPTVRVHSEGLGALVADGLHVFSSRKLNDGSVADNVLIGPMDGLLLNVFNP